MSLDVVPVVLGCLGLIAAFVLYRLVLRYPGGEGKVAEIAQSIHIGAMTFMRREYSILFLFAAFLTVAIWLSDLGGGTAFAFVVGAVCSSVAGYIGM